MTSNRIGFAIASLCSAKHFKSAKVLGKNSDCYGVGFRVLASFVNHSRNLNARRFHVGDHALVHASRDVKAVEEITFACRDVLSPLSKRKEMSKKRVFHCICKRCKYEEEMCFKQETKEIEIGVDRGMWEVQFLG